MFVSVYLLLLFSTLSDNCKLQWVAKIKAVYLLLGRATERFKQKRMFVSSVESDTDETNTHTKKKSKNKNELY